MSLGETDGHDRDILGCKAKSAPQCSQGGKVPEVEISFEQLSSGEYCAEWKRVRILLPLD